MIRTIEIKNFKSIPDLTLDLGRVTVLIGANGCGKSNVLEAIALASAAAEDKVDNEFLVARGIRMTDTRFMHSAFPCGSTDSIIGIYCKGDKDVQFNCELLSDPNSSYPKLVQSLPLKMMLLTDFTTHPMFDDEPRKRSELLASLRDGFNGRAAMASFLIFAPENSSLRTFQAEGQVLPLGIKGEGLFAHLKALSGPHQDRLAQIQESLKLIDWFESFEIPEDLGYGERSIRIRDRFLVTDARFDQRSANEGFLFLLFYLTLLVSPEAPRFFAIDNIDTSLNPKLCVALIQQLVVLARQHDKQLILTTHNPAILDGLDLHDGEQRLIVVDRNKQGHTRVGRVEAPKVSPGQVPVSLSEAFLRGYIGGLPKNF